MEPRLFSASFFAFFLLDGVMRRRPWNRWLVWRAVNAAPALGARLRESKRGWAKLGEAGRSWAKVGGSSRSMGALKYALFTSIMLI